MPIKVTTERDRIRGVHAAWTHSYRGSQYGADKRKTGQRLAALDLETCSAAEVNAIIGNASWTSEICNNCRATISDGLAITVGDEPDYESCTATICETCLREVLRIVGAAAKGET